MSNLNFSGVDPFVAPPVGMSCDCKGDDHFHMFSMSADCDRCGDSGIEEVYNAFTVEDAAFMLEADARGRNWVIVDGKFICSFCNS